MFKAQRAAYVTLAVAWDVLALVLAFAAVWAWRSSLAESLVWMGDLFGHPIRDRVRRPEQLSEFGRIVLSPNPLVNIRSHLWVMFISIPAWLFFLQVQRAYEPITRRSSRHEFAICAYAGMLATVVLVVFMFLAKFESVSRLLIVGYLIIGTTFLWVGRTILLPVVQRRGRRPVRNILIIGNATAAERFGEILKTPAYRWSRIIGFICDDPGPAQGLPEVVPAVSVDGAAPSYLGKLADLAAVLDREVIDEVVIVRSQADLVPNGPTSDTSRAWGNILELCLQRGRTVSLVDDIAPPVGAKVEATMMGTMPTLVMHNTPQDTLSLVVKNLMDRTVAFVALLFIGPLVMLPIAIAIKLTSPGPVFFRQKRVGLNGRQFWFYKFRSMIVNAEKFKEEHPELFAEINTMSGPFFKSDEDPRITKVGKFLRKSSLDELPQFWNVLRGDMSLVGPRPPLPREVEQLEPWQRRKLSVKGGLTCLWQVSGRNEIDTDEWMRLDLEYIDNWSLWLDVKLLFKTLKVLIKPKGAS